MQENLNLKPVKMNSGRNLQPGILCVLTCTFFFSQAASEEDDEVVLMIKELLDTRIR